MIHLAAQAGVRYSLENPAAYVESNLTGFTHVLEACRQAKTPHLVFASTSSVYGANTAMPFSEGQEVGHPLQFYAATKRANELMAHAYAHLFALPCTGLRFFTVYGPWGRPDMAPMLFADAISAGPADPALQRRPAQPRLHLRRRHRRGGDPRRRRRRDARPGLGPGGSRPRHLGGAVPDLQHRQRRAGRAPRLHRRARARARAPGDPRALPPQPGDVPDTWADCARLEAATGWRPATPVAEGVARFVAWYKRLHRPLIARKPSRARTPGGYTRGRVAGPRPCSHGAYASPGPACVRGGLRRRSRDGCGDAASIGDAPFGAVVPAPAGYLPPYVRAVIAEAARPGWGRWRARAGRTTRRRRRSSP